MCTNEGEHCWNDAEDQYSLCRGCIDLHTTMNGTMCGCGCGACIRCTKLTQCNVAETKGVDANAQYGSSTELVHWDQHYVGNGQRRKKGKNADAAVEDAGAMRNLAPTRRSSQ